MTRIPDAELARLLREAAACDEAEISFSTRANRARVFRDEAAIFLPVIIRELQAWRAKYPPVELAEDGP